MFTNPSSARVLELIRESLERDVVPELQTERRARDGADDPTDAGLG